MRVPPIAPVSGCSMNSLPLKTPKFKNLVELNFKRNNFFPRHFRSKCTTPKFKLDTSFERLKQGKTQKEMAGETS